MSRSAWLMRLSGTAGRMRLFCFPYAGGSATAFAPWQAHLPTWIELIGVQLPGRGARLTEPPFTDIEHLLDALAPVIEAECGAPYAFFGHSLGGLLAFALTRRLRRRGLPPPMHLFASASGAPHLRSTLRRPLHLLGDDDLLGALRDYNGTPPEALAHGELMALLLPAIRADFALRAGYRHHEEAPLDTPITVFAGTRDPHVSPEQLDGWRDCTTASCSVHRLDGDHFFLHAHARSIASGIVTALAPATLALINDAAIT